MIPSALLLTCEHASNAVPGEFAPLFVGAEAVLASHRGWDPGSLELALHLAEGLDAPLVAATETRLLVELNRSLHHPRLFSEYTRPLPREIRQRIIERYYVPHVEGVRARIDAMLGHARQVVHIGIHSFTPALDGTPRDCDVGLLYDPARASESTFCRDWQRALRAADETIRVRRNFPYRGNADGLTTSLRRRHSADRYLGIELEVSQAWPLERPTEWIGLRDRLLATLRAMLGENGARRGG